MSSVYSLPNQEIKTGNLEVLRQNCAKGLSPTCLKIGAITLIEKLNSKNEVTLIPGVTLIKDGDNRKVDAASAEIAKSLPTDDRLDKFLLYQLESFLDTHSVKLKLLDESAVEEAKSMIEEGRARGGLRKKGGMGPLIAMAMMMKGE